MKRILKPLLAIGFFLIFLSGPAAEPVGVEIDNAGVILKGKFFRSRWSGTVSHRDFAAWLPERRN